MRTLVLCMSMLALLSGCAGNPPAPGAPSIARITPEELERLQPAPVPSLPPDEIIRMSQAGATPDLIIAAIRDSHSGYALTPSQMIELNHQGVDGRVLDYIQAANEQSMRDSFADELSQRERAAQEKIRALERELAQRPLYYDPFWGPSPYWPYPYGYPYWRHW